MELEAVELSDFRAYREARLVLPSSGLVFLAGANNTGKSALLSALDVVAGEEAVPMAQHIGSTDPPQVRALFRLSEEESSGIAHDLERYLGQRSWSRDVFNRLEWSFTDVHFPGGGLVNRQFIDGPHQRMINPIIRSSGPGYPTTPLTPLAWLDRSKAEAFLDLEPFVEPMQDQNGPASSFTGRGRPARVETLRETLKTELRSAFQLLSDWQARYYHLMPLRLGTARRVEISSNPKLRPTGNNLGAVLLDLQTNRIDLWLRLRDLLEQIIPEVGRLETPTSNQWMEVSFVDPYVPTARYNIKDLGTGVEQLLMTLVVGVTQQAPAIIVIEEPETNLHPGAQRALLELLREWSSERLFILSTHSPVFLDEPSSTVKVFLTQRTKGLSTVRTVSDERSEALAALGVRPSDILSADRVLLVEGPSDQNVIGEWFPDMVRNPRLIIIGAQGGDNARFAKTLETWVQTADRLGDRRILYLRDRDELSETLLKPLEASTAVHVLKRRELENYLLDAQAICNVLMRQRPTLELNSASVGAELRNAADKLKQAVIIKRVAWELAPVRLMDHELREDLARQGVTLEAFRDRISARLPLVEDLTRRIDALWAAAQQDVNNRWDTSWYELAPGSDILKSVWVAYGLSYGKQRDGIAIAAAMERPPEELRDVLQTFLT